MKQGIKKGISIGLNFGNVYDKCKYPDKAGSTDSDYEIWSPSDGRAGVECLLGHKIQIVRRKRESKCINTEKFERKITKLNCDCTELDYMCDMGYERTENSFTCTRIGDGTIDDAVINKPPTICNKVYKISKGYRRIPGDTCVNGVKYDPIVVPCPYKSTLKSFVFYFFILFIVVFIVVMCVFKDKDISFNFDLDGIYFLFNKMIYGDKSYSNDDEGNSLFQDDSKIIRPIGEKNFNEETKPINIS